MYYYTLKCVLYRLDALSSLPLDLFGPFPTIDTASTLYLQNYKHTHNKAPPLRRRSSQPPHLQPKHVPPTPIHNTKSRSHHSLEGQIDFRLGPLELLTMDISHQNNKKKKRIVTEHTLQLGFGVLHLYRDTQPLTEQELPDTKIARDESLILAKQPILTKDEDLTLCVVAVPSYMTQKDFINFLGSANSNITQYRFIR
jgi:BRCA1-associated protein